MEFNWHPMWNIYRRTWYLPLVKITDGPFSRNVLFEQIMKRRGIIPTQDEILKRKEFLEDLQHVVDNWIKAIGDERNRQDLSALVVPYGSYSIEVYSGSSDVDILVIAPALVSMESDFFGHLRELIETFPNITNMRSVRSAIVPLLKFNVRGIDVDLACARVNETTFSRAEILQEHKLCVSTAKNDESSRLVLESVESNWTILRCVQANKENFVQATRFLKYWAKRRRIYGNINCYLGGVHLVVMVAFICKFYKRESFAGIIACFFEIFSTWSWYNPVIIHGDSIEISPRRVVHLPIQKPGTNTLCPSNVTPITLATICDELKRGYVLTQVLSHEWSHLVDEFTYEVYDRFIKVHMSVTNGDVDEWMGFVKSRIWLLIELLEKNGIGCDPSIVEFRDPLPHGSTGCKDQNRVFLWGIVNDTGERYDLTEPEQKWMQNLNKKGGLMGVKLSVIPKTVYLEYKCRNMVRRA